MSPEVINQSSISVSHECARYPFLNKPGKKTKYLNQYFTRLESSRVVGVLPKLKNNLSVSPQHTHKELMTYLIPEYNNPNFVFNYGMHTQSKPIFVKIFLKKYPFCMFLLLKGLCVTNPVLIH